MCRRYGGAEMLEKQGERRVMMMVVVAVIYRRSFCYGDVSDDSVYRVKLREISSFFRDV